MDNVKAQMNCDDYAEQLCACLFATLRVILMKEDS